MQGFGAGEDGGMEMRQTESGLVDGREEGGGRLRMPWLRRECSSGVTAVVARGDMD